MCKEEQKEDILGLNILLSIQENISPTNIISKGSSRIWHLMYERQTKNAVLSCSAQHAHKHRQIWLFCNAYRTSLPIITRGKFQNCPEIMWVWGMFPFPISFLPLGSVIAQRELKLDGAIGQEEICNFLKSEIFSKSFLSHVGKNK